ncbi:MAG: KTSC domain-containing protein [Verrucomicrobia bacterium]|nr:KTSC domain-containing protein [Verrucomicrobiota bacterium]MBU1909345.1 KTSC domain-containing protein [Verrucomicrobiota bacterium]
MEMTAVESSTIDEIGYDAEKQVLKIKFDNGEAYKYMGVPEATYKKLMKAKSKGKFFNAHIKDKFEAKQCD